MSLSPQTIRIRHGLRAWTKSGRKHWDLARHLYQPTVIYDALRLVMKNKGTSGVDGQTIDSIKGREWEVVQTIIGQLKEGTYRPGAVRRVYIPKRDGSQRPLGIPNLVDRIVQRALVLLLEPIYEEKFHDFSYGFRPRKKAVDCAYQVAQECYQRRYVFDADIEKFFDNVDHRKMMKVLEQQIADPRIHRWICSFLKSGIREPGKPWQAAQRGTPQGGPLSPLLANIYLDYFFDSKFAQVYGNKSWIKLIRYADDFVILTSLKSERENIERMIRSWLKEGNLYLKDSKTKWVDMSNANRGHNSKFEFLGFKFHMRCFKDSHDRFWIARQPTERARKDLREAIRRRLHVGMTQTEAIRRIQETWRGWCGYYRYSNANRIFYREADRVQNIVIWWLRKKYRRTRRPVRLWYIYRWGRELSKCIKPVSVISKPLFEGSLFLTPSL